MATIDPTPEQLLAHITGQPLRTGIHSDFNACMYRAGCQQTQAEFERLQADNDRLRVALRFYARSEHYLLDDAEEFDTVSGEPQNWLCSGREDSQTMVEDGQVARFALRGETINWVDGDEDMTPQPIDGERVLGAA